MIEDKQLPTGKKRGALGRGLPYIAFALLIYFGNVELQSYLGRRALEQTGLPVLSLDEALAQAKEQNKRVLANMAAIWCTACRKLDREVLSRQRVRDAIVRDYVFARVEYESEEGEAFMEEYQVRGFPTLLILDADGAMVRKLPLSFSPGQFVFDLSQR